MIDIMKGMKWAKPGNFLQMKAQIHNAEISGDGGQSISDQWLESLDIYLIGVYCQIQKRGDHTRGQIDSITFVWPHVPQNWRIRVSEMRALRIDHPV